MAATRAATRTPSGSSASTRGRRRDSRQTAFDGFRGDAAALRAHRPENPLFYAELQGGWYDSWGGPGYEELRDWLGADGIDNTAKAALAEGATLWNWFVFCGGVSWGYLGSPDVYTSYDFAAPVSEFGALGPRYEAVRRLNEFLSEWEEELAGAEEVASTDRWCPQHLLTRQGPTRRFVFLRNPTREPVSVPAPEATAKDMRLSGSLGCSDLNWKIDEADGDLNSISVLTLTSKNSLLAPPNPICMSATFVSISAVVEIASPLPTLTAIELSGNVAFWVLRLIPATSFTLFVMSTRLLAPTLISISPVLSAFLHAILIESFLNRMSPSCAWGPSFACSGVLTISLTVSTGE